MTKYFRFLPLEEGRRPLIYAVISLFITISLTSVDILHELHQGVDLRYICLEFAICFSACLGVIFVSSLFYQERKTRLGLDHELMIVKSDVEKWKQKVKSISQQFATAIDEQFTLWGLSKAEKDISLLLIKGMSSKDIAILRNVTEKTIRTHASAVYKKSGLTTRYELAAYFIDALIE